MDRRHARSAESYIYRQDAKANSRQRRRGGLHADSRQRKSRQRAGRNENRRGRNDDHGSVQRAGAYVGLVPLRL